jgi:hypothetical protein
MLNWIMIAAALLGATFALGVAIVSLNVWLGIFRQGSRVAEEAFRRGDSLASWADPSKTLPRAGPRHDARAALAGRRSKTYGVVAVTERASDHIYGQ